jgi:cell division protein FtsB
MNRVKAVKEVLIAGVTLLALYHAGRSIAGSVERQFLLHSQEEALKNGQIQAQQVNKELRDGLTNYRSSSGIERLARERLNLAAPDEIVIRIGK